MAETPLLLVEPVTLDGRRVRLEPASPKHARDLAALAEPEVFRFFAGPRPLSPTPEGVEAFIQAAWAMSDVRIFAIVLKETGKAVGTTSYLDVRPAHRGLEIGMTWIGRPYQGSYVNPECKLLLLEHAFERLGCIRVQLKTDRRNVQSQAAIEKLGAAKEGILRNHIVMPDGYFRDTVYYSILPDEWPAIRAGLERRLPPERRLP